MYDSTLSKEVQAFALYLKKRRRSSLPTNNYDLVLDVIDMENDEIVWAYYYVDHDSKTLFWQDSYDCALLFEVRGVREASHVSKYLLVHRLLLFGPLIRSIPELRLESLYWYDFNLYYLFSC